VRNWWPYFKSRVSCTQLTSTRSKISAVGGMREKAVVTEVENCSPSSGIGRAFRRRLWVEYEKYGKYLLLHRWSGGG
jgi:hypothetical protein